MPIEIKELHIKAIVTDKGSGPAARDHGVKVEYDKMRKELIEECIEKILQLLEDKKER